MHICSENEFRSLVSNTPGLCAWGMGNDSAYNFNGTFYRANKNLLLNSYREFVICCGWLRENCIPLKKVKSRSLTSRTLQQLAKKPHYVGNGAMIAAIIHLGIPYLADPHSPYVRVGVLLKPSGLNIIAKPSPMRLGVARNCLRRRHVTRFPNEKLQPPLREMYIPGIV